MMDSGLYRLSLGLVGLWAGSASGQNSIVFLDGGYSEMCATAAVGAESPRNVNITGSRLDVTPLEICTQAILEERGTPMQSAANHNNRGVLLFAEGNYDAARVDFERAITDVSGLAQAHVNLGYVLIAQQRWSDAIAPLSRGIELGALDLHKAHFNRGIAYEETGQVVEAYREYLKAAELAPEWEEPKRELTRFKPR